MKPTIGVGLLGFGVVNSGTFRLLTQSTDRIEEALGHGISVQGALVQTMDKPRLAPIDAERLTTDPEELIDSNHVHIIAEAMGGIEPARTYIERALRAGKHVVTANKELVARHGPVLAGMADATGVSFRFEATVAGGIPLILSLRQGLIGNTVDRVDGILNGTTNYILTRMYEDEIPFETALAQAQEKGFAEADPTADVEGIDAAHKVVILSWLLFGHPVPVESVQRQGITGVTLEEIRRHKACGEVPKLLANASFDGEQLSLRVGPQWLPEADPLSSVRLENNAIRVHGSGIGALNLVGKGAGQLPTGSAVLSDIVAAAADLTGTSLFRRFPGQPSRVVQEFRSAG